MRPVRSNEEKMKERGIVDMNKKIAFFICHALLLGSLITYAVATQSGVVQAANVVQNPSFETAGTGGAADAANWTEGTLHARASDKFNTGAWSLKSTYRSTGTDTRQTVTITTNTAYTYSGYIWRTNTVGGACMDMNDITGELTLCATTAGSWQFKTGTWNSGTNTSVTLRLITDGSPTGDVWFDDISLDAGGPTNTPTIWVTDTAPDLIVQSMSLEANQPCYSPTFQVGVRVYLKNIGNANAGAFVVDLNGVRQTVSAGLAAGQTTSLWFSNYNSGTTSVATVDVTNLVVELNESNNQLSQLLPSPTPPPTCTNTPTPTWTNTPSNPLPDLIVQSIHGALESFCGPWGLNVTVKNAGTANAGTFLVEGDNNSSRRQTVTSLAAGQSITVWLNVTPNPISNTATVDVTNLVLESNESNNTLTYVEPSPLTATPTRTGTPPPICTNTPTPTNTPAPPGNVVQNSSFETAGTGGAADAANWTEGTLHARASDKFNTGAWALKSTYRSTGTNTRQTVSITANHTYTYSGYIWRTNTVGGACMDMNDIAGELTLCATTAGSWQFKTGTWNSGALTSLTVRLITDASPTGDIWFDDISLQ
jgi:hypothetical protein